MEVNWVFLDVRFDRKESLIDEGRDFIVGIGFGLQPNACASTRSGAEVEQQGFLSSLCLSECRVYVFVPSNCHFRTSFRLNQSMRYSFYYTAARQISCALRISSGVKTPSSICEQCLSIKYSRKFATNSRCCLLHALTNLLFGPSWTK